MTAGPFLDYAGGLLRVEGVALAELAERLGTPFFLISESRLRANYQALERGLSRAGPGAVLRYCAKTNHEAAVLELLAGCGSHLLASHAAEAALAVRCGFPAGADRLRAPGAHPGGAGRGARLRACRWSMSTAPATCRMLEEAAARAGRRVRVSLRLRGGRRALPVPPRPAQPPPGIRRRRVPGAASAGSPAQSGWSRPR